MKNIPFNKQFFVGKTEGELTKFYEVIKQLGKGSYGKVYRIKNRTTGEIRACKQLSKSNIKDLDKFNREIDILIKTDHPNIIKLYEVFEDSRFLFLVMEECNGGELFEKIMKHIETKKMYSEKEAAKIFKQMMSAIAYCHSNKICHRDLKPENILYSSEDENSLIKVIDFGLSRIWKGKNMTTKVGTAYYVSPEVLAGKYDERCDIWSAGVILYILLSGEPPFNGHNDNEIYRRICKMTFTFPENKWRKISKEAKELIKMMLSPEDKRPTATQVLEHEWFKQVESEEETQLDFDLDKIKKYIHSNNLKKIVLTFIASRLKDNEVSDLRETFKAFDINKDGSITFDELKIGLTKLNIDITTIKDIFNSIDTDKSGRIDYTEFIAATLDEKLYLQEQRLYEVFKTFDKDNTGRITIEEIMKVLKLENDNPESEEKVKQILKGIDKNGNGQINYNEFLDMMVGDSKFEI
jgi:calcium-dependent protein kinase